MKERRRRREIARYFDKFQRTSTLTFLYDLLTGLEERERERERKGGWEGEKERNYVIISASGEIISLTPGYTMNTKAREYYDS